MLLSLEQQTFLWAKLQLWQQYILENNELGPKSHEAGLEGIDFFFSAGLSFVGFLYSSDV